MLAAISLRSSNSPYLSLNQYNSSDPQLQCCWVLLLVISPLTTVPDDEDTGALNKFPVNLSHLVSPLPILRNCRISSVSSISWRISPTYAEPHYSSWMLPPSNLSTSPQEPSGPGGSAQLPS